MANWKYIIPGSEFCGGKTVKINFVLCCQSVFSANLAGVFTVLLSPNKMSLPHAHKKQLAWNVTTDSSFQRHQQLLLYTRYERVKNKTHIPPTQ